MAAAKKSSSGDNNKSRKADRKHRGKQSGVGSLAAGAATCDPAMLVSMLADSFGLAMSRLQHAQSKRDRNRYRDGDTDSDDESGSAIRSSFARSIRNPLAPRVLAALTAPGGQLTFLRCAKEDVGTASRYWFEVKSIAEVLDQMVLEGQQSSRDSKRCFVVLFS